jgi:hypothetical protein
VVTWFANLNAQPAPLPDEYYTAEEAVFSYSDYDIKSVVGTAVRFSRRIDDIYTMGYSGFCPGARQRFTTSSQTFDVHVDYNGLHGTSLPNGRLAIYANGSFVRDHNQPNPGTPAAVVIPCVFGSAASRNIEVIAPYTAGIDFVAVQVPVGQTIVASAAPPATRWVFYGDSITGCYDCTGPHTGHVFKLRQSMGSQFINMGYAGRGTTIGQNGDVVGDATAVAQMGCNRIILAMGINSASQATGEADYNNYISTIRAIQPSVPIFVLTLIPNPPNDDPAEAYRVGQRAAVASRPGDGNLFLIEGPQMIDGSNTTFYSNGQGPHLTDAGAATLGTNLYNKLVALGFPTELA